MAKTKYKRPPNQSKGILDDFAVRKTIATRQGTIQKVPAVDYDIVNKKYVDGNFLKLDCSNDPLTEDLTVIGSITQKSSTSSGQVALMSSGSAEAKMWYGTITDSDAYMEMGAFSAKNNLDTKGRNLRLFATTAGTLVEFNQSTGEADFDDNTIKTTGDLTDGTNTLTVANAKTAYDHVHDFSINFLIDGGGSAITTGIKGCLRIPFACTISRATLLADQTGSIKIDVWKDTYANYPPTDADTICGGNEPEISAGVKDEDTTLTSWTTAINAGDILHFNVDSCATITWCLIELKITRS